MTPCSALSPFRSSAGLFITGLLASALVASALLNGCAASGPSPAQVSPTRSVALADYLEIGRVKGASFSHDDAWVAYLHDGAGSLDLWIQPTEPSPGTAPMASARRLVEATGKFWAYAFSPTRDQLLYETDEGGNGKPRLYLVDDYASSSAPVSGTDLLPEIPAGARIGFVAWSPDGDSILYQVNLPGAPDVTVAELDLASGRSTEIWTSASNLSFHSASPDFQTLVLHETHSDLDHDLYLVRRGQPEPQRITDASLEATYSPLNFSPDSRTLYFTSTLGGEFTGLYGYSVDDGSIRPMSADRTDRRSWDVERGGISRGGGYDLTVWNVDGSPDVQLRRRATGESVALPRVAAAGSLVPDAFSPSDRYVAATLVTDVAPRSLWLVDLESASARPLVEVLPASLREQPMVAGEAVRIPSFDGLEVPALLYRPAGAGPHPAVIDVHGGPHAQAKRRYSAFRQYLVAQGFAVLVPNVRGSTGYGRTYTALDNLDLGGGPLRDIVACKQWLARHAGVDGDRVAVLGASYGGYMALAAAAFEPGEFAAHVDYFGISDMKTLVESYPAYWRVYSSATFKKWGDPENPEHADYQRERSPLHSVDRIEGPLLVVQGDKDPFVPRDQSDRLVAALEGRDVDVYYMVLENEGHGFSKNASRLAAYQATDRFLRRYLRGDDRVEVIAPATKAETTDRATP